jgi:ArsR family transcriptional regulator
MMPSEKGTIMPSGEMKQIKGTEVALPPADRLIAHAMDAANFLKALGHDGRLMILCHLTTGPKTVTELENLLSSRQAVVSQQLARLRFEGLVSARRDKQTISYSILDPKVSETLTVLARLFCSDILGSAKDQEA